MAEENPLLKKISLPGRRFRLPSRGLFYTDGELDENVEDGEIEIFSMTALDEISLRSPEFLFNGEAIERVFLRCIPEVKKPLRLLALDVDFILTALRIVSYGGILNVELRCPECDRDQLEKNDVEEEAFLQEVAAKAEEQGVDINLALVDQQVTNRLKTIRGKRSPKHLHAIDLQGIISNQTTEISDDEYKKFNFTLSNGQAVKTTPLKMDSSVLANQFQNDDMSKDLTKAEDYVAFVIASCILQVDDVLDPQHIGEWTKGLPIALKQELGEKMGLQEPWGTKFDYSLDCPDCQHTRNGDALLNPITFFILPSEQVVPSS